MPVSESPFTMRNVRVNIVLRDIKKIEEMNIFTLEYIVMINSKKPYQKVVLESLGMC